MLNFINIRCILYNNIAFKPYLRINYQKQTHFSSMSKLDNFAPTYVPSAVENQKYDHWEANNSDPFSKISKLFSLILPPPNITGTLHLGHALTLTIQDVLIRWNKMRGQETVWIPGLDHAGIATQVVVEKKLWQETKQTRYDLGRMNFEWEVWKWKCQKSEVIRQQVKKLGALPNWNREFYTMDDKMSRAVIEAFIRLFDSGLIYRGDYLVNWSCVLRSAISDIEVEYLDVKGRTEVLVPGYEQPIDFGVLTKFAYKLCESDEELVVSTTRPETILGDTAVAIHPSDQRYTSLAGKYVMHPFRREPIPVICDEFVDPDFGTGAVKVTPAHDPVDFGVGRRHKLATLPVIDETGRILDAVPVFGGMKRFEARKVITERLRAEGLLRSIEDHPMTVPICSRSGDVVEYLIRPQWFVDCRAMARRAADDVRDGKLRIEPAAFEKIWFNWLENIRDWCISRQLWWGHRVPAYRCQHATQWADNGSERWIWVAADNPANARKKAASKLSTAPELVVPVQDEDVLDTWFSSALLPFAVFGWPETTLELNRSYPLTLMETGHDILFFWVARMVMLGKELTGQLPFDKVLLHGILCDAQGRKMSKSLGNVVAPEDVITGISLEALAAQTKQAQASGLVSEAEMNRALSGQKKMFPAGIPECGADALRFTLCSHNIKSHFINFDVNECYTNKLFCNKIWQACKYIRMSTERVVQVQGLSKVTFADLGIMDKWVLSRLSYLISEVNAGLEKHDFHVATAALKQFLYGDFCDVYLETTKPGLRLSAGQTAAGHVSTLLRCMDAGLRCLAPFMPFVVEELYRHLPAHPDVAKVDNISIAAYPKPVNGRNVPLEEQVQIILDTATVARRLMKLSNVTAKHKPKVHITSTLPLYDDFIDVLKTLSGCDTITISPESNHPNASISDTIGKYGIVHLLMSEQKPPNTMETKRLSKKIEKLVNEMDKVKKMINTDGFKNKASAHVQQAQNEKLAAMEEELSRLQRLQQS